ncbi:hypothetical protein ON010_g16097 [Phytophthora cinnamomi]|nr:hypothetical protein ON010_g16097 [Phytophthora cinnamomi]
MVDNEDDSNRAMGDTVANSKDDAEGATESPKTNMDEDVASRLDVGVLPRDVDALSAHWPTWKNMRRLANSTTYELCAAVANLARSNCRLPLKSGVDRRGSRQLLQTPSSTPARVPALH